MKVTDEREVYNLIKRNAHYLQTAIIAVPDERIVPLLLLFGNAELATFITLDLHH